MRRSRVLRSGAAVGAVAILAGLLVGGVAPTAQADGLTPFAGCDEFLEQQRGDQASRSVADLYGGSVGYRFRPGSPTDRNMVTLQSVTTAVTAAETRAMPMAGQDSSAAPPAGPTGTNVQEVGVDEPDTAKLADGRLVVLSGGVLHVLSSGPTPRLLGTVTVDDTATLSTELLLVRERAVVLAQGSSDIAASPQTLALAKRGLDPQMARDLIGLTAPATTATLIDLGQDRPRVIEKRRQGGNYLSARLAQGVLRLVTYSTPVVAPPSPATLGGVARTSAPTATPSAPIPLDAVLPRATRIDASGQTLDDGPAVPCTAIARPEQGLGGGLVTVTSMRPADNLATVDVDAVVAQGGTVYAAEDRLYVVTSQWPMYDGATFGMPGDVAQVSGRSDEIHAFATDADGTNRYVASGSVNGGVIGRWALSRYDGVLRVATTLDGPVTNGASERSSSVVKLLERDGALVEAGRIDGLAPGEDIKSVRYMGDMAAVVTYKQVDPLFLIDLSGKPVVIGELKLPGFSSYLHPLGDGLLLGIGSSGDDQGRVTGLQASVFNISTRQPTLVDQVALSTSAESGTPVTEDSRAFTYDPVGRRLIVPVSEYSPPNGYRTTIRQLSITPQGTLRPLAALALPDAPPFGFASRVLLDGETLHAIGSESVVTAPIGGAAVTGRVPLEQRVDWTRPSVYPTR